MTVGLSKSLSSAAHGIIWHWALVSCLGCLDSMAWNQHHPFLLVYNSRHLPSSQKSWWTQRWRRPFNMLGYNDTMRRGERKENNWYVLYSYASQYSIPLRLGTLRYYTTGFRVCPRNRGYPEKPWHILRPENTQQCVCKENTHEIFI